MTTSTIQRTLGVLWPSDPLIVEILQGKKRDVYRVRVIPSDYGPAYEFKKYEFQKPDGTIYHLSFPDGGHAHCDCPWGTYKPNTKPCRHLAAVLKLRASGRL